MLKFIEWAGIKLNFRLVLGNCSSRLERQYLGLNVIGVVQLPNVSLNPLTKDSPEPLRQQMRLDQPLPERAHLQACTTKLLGRQSCELMHLEEVDLTPFKRFPDIPQEVRNGQAQPYKTPHRDPCFTRQQGAELRVDI